MNSKSEPLENWVVQFDTERMEFKNFGAAITYADSLALSRALVKHIDPAQQLIELTENRQKLNYEFDYYVHRASDS